jgi:hypothetical protein
MTRRGFVRTAAAATLLALVASAAPTAVAENRAEALVRHARRVATHEAYTGVVEVYWQDQDHRRYVERVAARGLGGAFVVGRGDRRVIGHGDERLAQDGGSDVGWTAKAEHEAPAPDAAWHLKVSGSGIVAGRPVTFVEAQDRDGRARAVLALDAESGQLLERQILNRRGDIVRSVAFVQIVTGAIRPAVPITPDSGESAPVAVDEVPNGFLAPTTAHAGYELLGRYRHADGSVQLFYSDGLFTLSVFEQQGAVDWDRLPPGRCGPIADHRTCSYDTASGTIVVWSRDGLVLTAIGDAPSDRVVAIVGDFGDENDSGWTADIANFVLGPFGWD